MGDTMKNAFPFNDMCPGEEGLTVRQYYVAKNVAGLLSNNAMTEKHSAEGIVNVAFKIADLIIEFEVQEEKEKRAKNAGL